MSINQQIAEIYGRCTCEIPGVYYRLKDDHCPKCKKLHRVHYLAPENLHELVRVAVEMEVDNIEIEWLAGEWRICLTKGTTGSGYHFTKDTLPNEALGHAIVTLAAGIAKVEG